MRNYEATFIIRPGTAAEENLTAIIDKYSAVIIAHQGEVTAINRWGLKKLAYLIKKENQGFYLLIRFTIAPNGIKELERLLRIDERILKFLTIKLDDVGQEFLLNDDKTADSPDTPEGEEVETEEEAWDEEGGSGEDESQ